MSAHSLIDAAALPSWLAGQPGAAPAPQQTPGMSAAPLSDGMPAQSLVDEQALPQWLRTQPRDPDPSPPAAIPPAGPQVAQTLATSATEEPLPSWLNQVYSEAQVARVAPPQPAPWSNAALSGAPNPPNLSMPQPQGGGLSASQFVDESALPSWLKAQGGLPLPGAANVAPEVAPPTMLIPGRGPQPNAGAGAAAPPQVPFGQSPMDVLPSPQGTPDGDAQVAASNFSASDLIDPSALPSWMRQDQAPSASFSSATGWTQHQPAVQKPAVSPQMPVGASDANGAAAAAPQQNVLSSQAVEEVWELPTVSNQDSYASPMAEASAADLPAWLVPTARQENRAPLGAAPSAPGRARTNDPTSAWGAGFDAPANSGYMQEPRMYSGGLPESAAPRRRPLSDQELPPWLRSETPQMARGSERDWNQQNQQYTGESPRASGRADTFARGGEWGQAAGSPADYGWDDAQNGPDPYIGADGYGQHLGYAENMPHDEWGGGDPYRQSAHEQPRRGGWRRFFRRK